MTLDNFVLGVDVWEGSLEIDEQVLKDNGVEFMLVRLNDMRGGHHRDENFDNQWAQAVNFLRAVYFVYNPWVSGLANYNWLAANMPADAYRVAFDVEVKYPDYPPATYAKEVEIFKNLARQRWLSKIYTGGWFLHYLSKWPSDIDYWWARYPWAFYPPKNTPITWAEMKNKVASYGWSPDPDGLCPGPIKIWQISDRYEPEGTVHCTDINVWNGTLEELKAWWGEESLPEPEPLTLEERVTKNEQDIADIKGFLNI